MEGFTSITFIFQAGDITGNLGFFSGKGTESGAGGTFTPPSQYLWEDPSISSSLQMIMWPLVLSGVIGNLANVAANYVLLFVFHLGVM